MRRGFCNTIVFYDLSPQECDLKGWLYYTKQWCEDKGYPPLSIGLPHSRKLIQFKNGLKRLEKTNFENVQECSFHAGVKEPGTNEDWNITGDIIPLSDINHGKVFLSFDNDLSSFAYEPIKQLIQNLSQYCSYKYGIAYQRHFDDGPDWYALGSCGGVRMTETEKWIITDWRNAYFTDGKYRTGLLRDVYPYNILIDTHLTQPVQGTPLQQWILSNPTHGTLEKITATHWLWYIPQESISFIQDTLNNAKLLIACYKKGT